MKNFDGFTKGINLGGWLSQCGKDNYTKSHFDNFIAESDIKRIASWGLDHIRLPIDYNVIQNEDGSFIDWGFEYLDKCLEWCFKNGLNVILDLHKTCGFVFDDKTYCQFFDDEVLQNQFIALWEELAQRYAKFSPKVALELLNEITTEEMAPKWNKIANRTIDAIRKINTDVKIIIGGIYNNSIQGLDLLEKPHDENIVFTFHCYNPLIFTHQGAYWIEKMPLDLKINYPETYENLIAESKKILMHTQYDELENFSGTIDSVFFEKYFERAIAVSQKFDVPLYCGEYGVIDKVDGKNALRWFKDINSALKKYKIGHAVWSYKKMDFGLIEKNYESVLNELLESL